MKFHKDSYFNKQALYPALIPTAPESHLNICIVIPCYNEKNIEPTIQSIIDCNHIMQGTEIIVLINASERDSEDVKIENRRTHRILMAMKEANDNYYLKIYPVLLNDLKHKKSGVGSARKAGMDEAALRFSQVNNLNGIIVCLDADSIVQENYLEEIKLFFINYPKCPATSIHFEHPTEGEEYSEVLIYAIIKYELHLRYYIEAKKWAGLPYAFQTVGSAMAVRANAYMKEGGMNTRRAGEDFYFLHKFTMNEHFKELKTTTVIPSPRQSDRVPFGTGKAVTEIMDNGLEYTTYHPKSIISLKEMVRAVPTMYLNESDWKSQLHEGFVSFYNSLDGDSKLEEIRSNTANYQAFKKRFYDWFGAFRCMKYLHHMRDNHYPNVPVKEAARWLLNQDGDDSNDYLDQKELLLKFRAKAKSK